MTICFWSVAQHHSLAIHPIYNKMRDQGKDVVSLFNQPVKNLLNYTNIVSGTAPDVPSLKKKEAIYHFHSLSPYHINPGEPDYKHIPLFKGVMFPGEWWVDKWNKLPKQWAVVGWPKTDLLKPVTKHERTVLYASSMHDFQRMKTLHLLLHLSKKMGFRLIVKPHHGTAISYPTQLKEMAKTVKIIKSTVDVASYFPVADILVSESSGALWEFMATGKPSIQMIQAERWGRVYPGGVLKADFEDLEETLEKAFRTPTQISEWCKRVMGAIDGCATDRAIKFIEETFNE